MKRLLTAIMMVLISTVVMAAGTCELETDETHVGSDRMWRTYRCTADASDGSFAAYTVTGFSDYYLHTVEIRPGATTPTDGSDLTITHATSGEDLLGGNGVNSISATDSTSVIARSTFMSTDLPRMVTDNVEINITGNSVNSGEILIKIIGGK